MLSNSNPWGQLVGACAVIAALSLAAAAEESPLVEFRSLSPDAALEVAQAALDSCRNEGYQVAVAVVDRMGVTQVVLRDRYAGPHALDSAERKAWTAVSFRQDTLTLAASTPPDSEHAGVREIGRVLMLGGGIPVSASGSVVGAVGVAGALSAEADHSCAEAGIEAVATALELSE